MGLAPLFEAVPSPRRGSALKPQAPAAHQGRA
jgi:hypothetical protein